MKAAVLAAVLAGATPSISALVSNRPKSGIKAYKHPQVDAISSGTFDQLLDHNDSSKGTFSQRYWWDAQYYGGPGSPVFVFNAGETAADDYTGYLNNGTIPGLYAQKFGGLTILVEHRYWGKSIPYSTLTAETLQYLDLAQSIHDMTYFAKKVQLGFLAANATGYNADSAPWVLIGGSYAGALAAWTQQVDPGVFWAYHASSAVVQAVYDFYPYFDAVRVAIPQNCSADVRSVVAHLDSVFGNASIASGSNSSSSSSNNNNNNSGSNDSIGTDHDSDSDPSSSAVQVTDDMQSLANLFGLGALAAHPDDLASQIALPMWAWQGSEQSVFDFCDRIESAGRGGNEDGVGLTAALSAYAEYINETVAPNCAGGGCDTYSSKTAWNQPGDLTGDRQWDWMLCHNPLSWWQVGPPTNDGQHVVSSLLQPGSNQRQCGLMFPTTNGFAVAGDGGRSTDATNTYTGGGWDAAFERVMFVNGQYDPWLPATVSSPYRAGGPRASDNNTMPIFVVAGGNHVPDLIVSDANADYVDQEVGVMRRWLGEWTDAQAGKARMRRKRGKEWAA